MSTNIHTNEVSNNRPVFNTSFAGGQSKGICLQMSQSPVDEPVRSIQMTKEQVIQQMNIMANWLADF